MERLTRSSAINATLKSDTEKNEFDCVCLGCRKFNKCIAENKKCNLFLAIEKLAAYEDTGLEPEEILSGLELAQIAAMQIRYQEAEKRMSDFISSLHDEYGCLLNKNLTEKYGDCRKGCYKCICDALNKQVLN